ncbi:DNA primase [Cryomorphaceae bacterium]|nr:DNA primase [Cryomorphaceae bacterium]
MIPKETVDRIFEAARIEEVIGEFVQLKRSGSNLKGLSPFSNEKTPSFVVSPAKQIYKDFSSGKGGSVVNFLMEHEHFTYPEALRYLADKYGIEIEEKEQTPEELKAANERESLFIVSKFAAEWFHDQLKTDEGRAIAYGYLRERGFSDQTIEDFQLGYNPDQWTALTDSAIEAGYQLEYLDKAGLTIVRDEGAKKFDRFKGRVMFPIHNLSGRVIAFGGRTLKSDKSVAKYVNSPETSIYSKSKVLYGIYQAKQTIVKEDVCYLVEGYTDVISLYQAGIKNVVASSGTALTPDQIRLIRRYTPNVVILYDGDPAGIRASFRGIDLILSEGMNVKVVLFPDGEDPDSFAKSRSNEEVTAYLDAEAKDFLQFKSQLLLEEAKGDPVRRAALIREILTSVSKIPDRITRDVYVRETARMFEMGEDVLYNELAQQRRKDQNNQRKREQRSSEREVEDPMSVVHRPVKGPSKPTLPEDFEQEKGIIALLLNHGSHGMEIENPEWDEEVHAEEDRTEQISLAELVVEDILGDGLSFRDERFAKVFNSIVEGIDEGEVRDGQFFVRSEDQELSALASELLSEPYELSDWSKRQIFVATRESKIEEDMRQKVLRFKERKVLLLRKEVTEELKKELDDATRQAHLQRLLKLNQVAEHLSKPLGRIL